MFRDDIVSITTGDATITALVGDRIYPDVIPESPVYPLIVYHAYVSDNNAMYRAHDGAGRTETRVQFDCYAERGRVAVEISDALVSLWNGYQNLTTYDIGRSFKADRVGPTWEPNLDSYRVITDFLVEHGE